MPFTMNVDFKLERAENAFFLVDERCRKRAAAKAINIMGENAHDKELPDQMTKVINIPKSRILKNVQSVDEAKPSSLIWELVLKKNPLLLSELRGSKQNARGYQYRLNSRTGIKTVRHGFGIKRRVGGGSQSKEISIIRKKSRNSKSPSGLVGKYRTRPLTTVSVGGAYRGQGVGEKIGKILSSRFPNVFFKEFGKLARQRQCNPFIGLRSRR